MSEEKTTPAKRSAAELVKIMRDCASNATFVLPSGGFVALTSNISPSVLVEAADMLDGLHMAGVPDAVTEREAVLRERKAFERGAKAFGAKWFISGSVERQAHKDQAAKDYPLPVRRRPLTVELSDGSQWRRREGSSIVDSLGPFANCSMYSLRNRLVTADDFRAIARMLDNETEEVPEGEE